MSDGASSSTQRPAWGRPATFTEGWHDEDVVRRMPYRELGRTGRQVSALALGASSLGGVFGREAGPEEARAIVEGSVRGGVNVIDVAPWYGHGKAEEALGHALTGVPRSAYYLHTKVGRYDPDPRGMFDFRAERVERSVEESLARLGVEYLDVVQVHDPEFAPSLRLVAEQTLPALARLRDRGKIRGVGITGYPLAALTGLAEAARRAGVALDTCLSYCRLDLHDTSLVESGALETLRDAHGLGVINASPVAMGLLTQRGPPAWHPAGPEIRAAAADAARLCSERGCDLGRLAMAFALRQAGPATCMVSTSSSSRAAANLAAATGASPLTDAEEAALLEVRERCFAPLQARAAQHWEGVEVQRYWAKLGRSLWTERMYPAYAE